MGPNHQRIEHDANLHPPVDERVGDAMDELRGRFIDLAHHVDTVVPAGRELSLALTHLIDEALHHAIAGIARNQEKFLAAASMRGGS